MTTIKRGFDRLTDDIANGTDHERMVALALETERDAARLREIDEATMEGVRLLATLKGRVAVLEAMTKCIKGEER